MIGYLVLLARHLREVDRDVACPAAPSDGVSLAGRTLGVIGLGGIGRRLARGPRASACGWSAPTSMMANGRRPATQCRDFDVGLRLPALDAVSLNCPLTPENHHLVERRERDREMKPAPGSSTQRAAGLSMSCPGLSVADGQIGAAALDVFEVEPLPDESPLRNHRRVILGSHNSSNTVEAEHRTSERAIDNLAARAGGR